MRSRRALPLTAVLVVALIAVVLPTSIRAEARSLQDIERELEQAEQQRERIDGRIAGTTERIDELEVLIAALDTEREQLADEVVMLRGLLDELEALVADRLRTSFMHGSGLDPVTVFLGSDDPAGALNRAQVVGRLVAADQARSESLLAARVELAAAEQRLAASSQDLAEARSEQLQAAAQLQAAFEEAGELIDELSAEARAERERLERERRERERRERERRERLERERAAAAAATASAGSGGGRASSGGSGGGSGGGGGYACPLDHPRHFTDSWGAPRSGGRAHRGTDLMGPYHLPVRAITSGTWSIQRPGPSAGLWGILRGDDGTSYWYLHLASHTVGSGARVRAGQQVGTNGSTGNAAPGAPHVHFEQHPGGGSAINPSPLLRRVCG